MEENKETCPVCYEEIKKYGFCVTNCSHIFCMDCMVKCIKTGHDGCPLCRENMCSTNIDSVLCEKEREEVYSEGYEAGHISGYEQASIECDQHYEQLKMRIYNRGYKEGTDISKEIINYWKNKYNGLDKIYKGTVHQLQKTNTLSKPYKEQKKLSRSTSA